MVRNSSLLCALVVTVLLSSAVAACGGNSPAGSASPAAGSTAPPSPTVSTCTIGVKPNTDASAAVAAGNKALTDAANAISWATSQGSAVNGAAQQLSGTADVYASAHCG